MIAAGADAGAGQRRGVLLGPVRCVRDRRWRCWWPGRPLAAGSPPAGPPNGADRDRRAADRGAAGRRRELPQPGSSRTTLARAPGSASPLRRCWPVSWSWAGIIFALAACGVIISWGPGARARARAWLLAVLVIAVGGRAAGAGAACTPTASLNKHVGLGAWFAALAAATPSTGSSPPLRQGRARALDHRRRAWSRSPSPPCWAPASPGSSPPTGPTPPASSRSSAPSPTTAPGRCWSKTLHRRVLPAGRRRLAAVVLHPQHRAALGRQHRSPHQPGHRRRGRPRHLRPLHRRGLLLPGRPQLRRHRDPWPGQIANRPAPPHHYKPIQVVPYGTEVPPIGEGTYVIYQHEPGP